MEEQDRLDSLSDTLFELMENISNVEESLENFKSEMKAEVESLKSALNQSKADSKADLAKKAQSKKADSELAKRFKKLEANVNTIIDSGVLESLSKKISAKMLIKKEIRRYQFMIMLILVLVIAGIAGFFYFNLSTTMENLIALGAGLVPFIIALLIINRNLKISIMEEKRTRHNVQSEISIESHTLDMPEVLLNESDAEDLVKLHHQPPAQHREKEIRSTFDE